MKILFHGETSINDTAQGFSLCINYFHSFMEEEI